MSSKLVFTVGSVELCELTVGKLRSLGIDDDSIGVIANDQTAVADLPDADFLHNDAVPAMQRGGITGAVTGLVAGLGVSMATPGLIIGGAGLAIAAVGGASFGTLVSGLVGAAVPNRHLEEYEEALNRGEILLTVHLEDHQEHTVKSQLLTEFPSLKLDGELPDDALLG